MTVLSRCALPPVLAVLALPATLLACGGNIYHGQASQTATAPGDVYTCARTELRQLGYQERSHDDLDFRVVAERIDDTVRRPDTQFRRLFDRMIVEIAPDAAGSTRMVIEAHTFAELQTQRGQTFDEESVRPKAKADAQALAQRCAP